MVNKDLQIHTAWRYVISSRPSLRLMVYSLLAFGFWATPIVLHSVSHNINIIYDVVCRGQNGVYDSRRYSRSAIRHHLTVPRYRLSTFGHRAFSVAGPTVWNSLPDSLRDPALNRACSSLLTFRRETKSHLFRQSVERLTWRCLLRPSANYSLRWALQQ